ncbi:MAG: hypothetical protein P4L84_27260 [Isosphaeraceae bacterium]|nr:hypothetical protein [Isosphaeraceae bacterium]
MLLLAPPRPSSSNPAPEQAPKATTRPEPQTTVPQDAKTAVCLNALDVAGEARKKLARRGYDWS